MMGRTGHVIAKSRKKLTPQDKTNAKLHLNVKKLTKIQKQLNE